MAINQKLQLKLTQRLILTPSLQQAIKLLPMSSLELSETLNQEIVENPMLEEIPNDEVQDTDSSEQIDSTDHEVAQPTDQHDTWDDADYEYFFGDYLGDNYKQSTPNEFRELPPIENILSTSSSLGGHLIWQLSIKAETDRVRDIGSAIIGNLDDDGYLVASDDEILSMGDWSLQEVENSIELVQEFDPIGVAARDLRECLLLQIRQLGLSGTASGTIVKDYLPLLQNNQISELARLLNLSFEEIKKHIEIIRRLDPRPGSRYNLGVSQYVIPDVYVVKKEDRFVAILNDEGLPRLRISPTYRHLLDSTGDNSDETKNYVKEKFRSALWLIKSVDQRQKTIHKVAESLITFQHKFLEKGVEYLKPLVLRDVANDIDMHESTVSRVVSNKYIHTPQGVFEMKYFFHSGISSLAGINVSSVTVKQRIRKLIEDENSKTPLSDSMILVLLKNEGLTLARRTIAKYREELKIPTASQRRVVY